MIKFMLLKLICVSLINLCCLNDDSFKRKYNYLSTFSAHVTYWLLHCYFNNYNNTKATIR